MINANYLIVINFNINLIISRLRRLSINRLEFQQAWLFIIDQIFIKDIWKSFLFRISLYNTFK